MQEKATAWQAGHPQQTVKRAGPRTRIRSARTRFRWFGLLLAGGLGLLAVAYFAVYPRPETAIPVPPSPSLVIYTSGPVSQITYVVTNDPLGEPEMQITVSSGEKLVGSQVVPLPIPTQGSSLEVTLPPGLAFRDCGSACVKYAGEVAWVKPLNFQTVTGKATDVFPIETADFGVDVSSVYAYAAIPEVSFMSLPSQQNPAEGEKTLPPALSAEYRIPTVGRYDWSSGPVPTVRGSVATWQEILATGETPGQTAVGVNHGQQVHDADFTFLAGFLLGLAGSVVLAGFQLLLPAATGSDAGRKDAGAPSVSE
jgi:hypothetical protein